MDGSDLLDALAGRIPEDDPNLVRFLQRSVNGVYGWAGDLQGEHA